MDSSDGGFISKQHTRDFGERFKSFEPNNIIDDETVNPTTTYQTLSEILQESEWEIETENAIIDDTNSYKMTKYPRGKLIIVNINNISYDSVTFPLREGSKKDCEELRQLFLSFGFIVDVIEDVNREELLYLMKKASQQSYKQTNALFVAFLTHGQEKHIFASDGKLEIKRITNLFRGENLAGKPKVFIIQSCRGSDYMGQLAVDGPMLESNTMELPVEADFLYAYATVPGFTSFRNKATGSWFIQILCHVFQKHGRTMDVVRMLTKVNNLLCDKTSHTDDPLSNKKKQISSVVSQLRKELYLRPPPCKKESSF